MDKKDNVQAPTSTSESSVTDAQSSASGTPSTALGNPGFLQSIQQRFDSMGDDVGSFLVGRYDENKYKDEEFVIQIIMAFYYA